MNSTIQDKSFSPRTYIKRGMKTVRARATEFIDTLRIQKIKELPITEAQDQFSLTVDVWDRMTIKAYFGTLGGRNTWVNQCRRQWHTGTVTMSNIEMTHTVTTRKGYLEKLGLVHYEKRGKTWIMVLESAQITPELMKSNDLTMRNFSLSSNQGNHEDAGEGLVRETNLQARTQEPAVGCPYVDTTERKKRESRSVRERNRSSESEAYSGILPETSDPRGSE